MNALVTGGGGFLGGVIVRQLLARGDNVRSVSRQCYPGLDIEQLQGTIANPAVAEKAVAGCDVIFHVAAKAGVWGTADEYYRSNIVGTENVIAASRKRGC